MSEDKNNRLHSRRGEMPGYGNNLYYIGQDEQPPDQQPPEAERIDALVARTLTSLGLWREIPAPAGKQMPTWQKQVIDVQKLAGICTRANVRQVVEVLEKDLEHSNSVVRMAVVRTLGKIHLTFPGYVRWVLFMRGLADQAPEVRTTTIQVFMTFVTAQPPRPPHAQAVERLVKTLSRIGDDGRAYEDESVNVSIIQLMGLLADLAPDTAIAALVSVACNHREDWPIREAAILALGSLYSRLSAEQRLSVDDTLYDEQPFVRQAAISALRGHVSAEITLEVLRTGNRQKQVYAAQALAQWGERLTLEALALDTSAASSARAAALLGLAQLAQTQDVVIKPTNLNRLAGERDFAVSSAAKILKGVCEIRNSHTGREESLG